MNELSKALNNKIKDNKIICRDALEIANLLGIDPLQVGEEIDKMGIKVKSCQLGCFK